MRARMCLCLSMCVFTCVSLFTKYKSSIHNVSVGRYRAYVLCIYTAFINNIQRVVPRDSDVYCKRIDVLSILRALFAVRLKSKGCPEGGVKKVTRSSISKGFIPLMCPAEFLVICPFEHDRVILCGLKTEELWNI